MSRKIVLICFLATFLMLIMVNIPAFEYKDISKEINMSLPISKVAKTYEKLDCYRNKQTLSFNDSEEIDEYTWSVLRYDCEVPSENFGTIHVPKPSHGSILVPANMMSIVLCRATVTVYHEDKMETLWALEDFDVESMIHTSIAFTPGENEWNSPSIGAFRKESATEMAILGERSGTYGYNLVGDCYAQAAFNTAVLRLCGFSAEEVFTVAIHGHAVNIVKIKEKWYAFDSGYGVAVDSGDWESLIFELYDPPRSKSICFLENDKYFINFGYNLGGVTPPHFLNLYSNINPNILVDIVDHIVPLFNNSALGIPPVEIEDFLENATECPWMATVAVPYTVKNATGSTIDEKAKSLCTLNKEFIFNQTGGEILNQYDRSIYCTGLLKVEYPQAYANAARYAARTSWNAIEKDTDFPFLDCLSSAFRLRLFAFNREIMLQGCVAFSDLLYIRRAGSSADKAVLAYGTLRNMEKNGELWQPENLYILITEDFYGYLAVENSFGWLYLNFDRGRFIRINPPENVIMAFNEIECLPSWEETK